MPMDEEPDFYTQKGYQMRSDKLVTSAMEDYLEMICRQARMEGYARINFLAHRLNVRPSSASKMVYQLHRFFCCVNGTTDELEQVEQVEHYINETTLRNLAALMDRLDIP